MAGLTAAARVLPHRLTAAGLRMPYGLPAEGLVPDGAPAAVTAERRKPPGGRDGLQGAPGGIAYLAVGGRTDLTPALSAPVVMQGFLCPAPPATTLCLAADDPAGLAAALQARMDAAPGA